MDELVVIQPNQVDDIAGILINAYPGMGITTPEKIAEFKERIIHTQSANSNNKYYGLLRDGTLVGGMVIYDYTMNLWSTKVPAGGVGFVAVDFMRKKERVGKELIARFLQYSHAKGAAIALLYAFRTDFYQKMGFGFGPQMYQYQIPTARLPHGSSRSHIEMLTTANLADFHAYYARLVGRTHGMIDKSEAELRSMLASTSQRVVAYREGDDIRGFMMFSFKPYTTSNFGSNNIFITEMFYDHPDALMELLTFLHSQADQIHSVIFNTQDEYFYHVFPDARNETDLVIPHVYHQTNTAGVGLMYRVLDMKRLFDQLQAHDFNNVSCTIKFIIEDDFYPLNDGSTTIRFTNGHPSILPDDSPSDAEVSMHISDFSSLVMGVIPFTALLRYGRASISAADYISTVNRAFHSERPVCTARF